MLSVLPLILFFATGIPPAEEPALRDEVAEVLQEEFQYAKDPGSPAHVEAVLELALQELPVMEVVTNYNFYDLTRAMALKAREEPADIGYVLHTRKRGLHGGELTTGIWPEIERRYLQATNDFNREVKLTLFRFEW